MSATVIAPAQSFSLGSGGIEALKWVALLAMVIDHINAVFWAREAGVSAEVVGRLAFPLFAVVLGYNVARPGVDLHQLFTRLLLFGVLAMPAHMYLFAVHGGWWPANVLFTFAVAVAAVLLVRDGQRAVAFALVLSCGALVEFWWPGIALVLASWSFFSRPSWSRAAGIGSALCFLCVLNGNAWALLVVPVVLAVSQLDVAVPRLRWVFWWFYPLHLVALSVLVLLA